MQMNGIQKRYMKLFGIEEPDYTTSPISTEFVTSCFTRDPLTGSFHRDGLKIGRNEPCPCGSGYKYKKCCGGH